VICMEPSTVDWFIIYFSHVTWNNYQIYLNDQEKFSFFINILWTRLILLHPGKI
jgi:hypothetical protein